ncbi:MAG TPA: hypothetical protein VLW53_18315 [Candidatus Eisenbacteria bacterium]|nr:hypothetical protein [Candidatus Eisenbacteria bacterium]
MRLRVPFPQSGLVLVGLVIVIWLAHTVGPALSAPAGGPFPSGSFQIQSTVDGTCVGLLHGSESSDGFRLAPLALVECKVVPEQTWRYDRGQHHLIVASTLAGPCADQGIRTVEVAHCWSLGSGQRGTAEQWALTADGGIIGGELASLGGLVTGIPRRGCWQANGQEIDVTTCSDALEQRWRPVPVS